MLGGLNDCPLHLSMPLPIRNIYLLGRDQNQGWLLSFSPCLLKSHGAQEFYKSISWQLQPSSAKILKSRHLFHRSPNFWHQPVPCLLGEMSGSIHDLEPLRFRLSPTTQEATFSKTKNLPALPTSANLSFMYAVHYF